ncbi:MAG: hypothetical protein U5K69_05820 [Balneolaceae bacterium]|nr:hypothetical protein [Balneolaceae bacterium]
MEVSQLYRYLAGDCSPVEERSVENWISKHPENRAFFRSIQKIWQVEPQDEFNADLDSGWKTVEKRIETYSFKRIKKQRETNSRVSTSREKAFKSYLFAAAVGIFLVAALLVMQHTSTSEPAPTPVTMQQIQTKKGQRASFTLSDGTKVHLNADTRLKILDRFQTPKTGRSIWMERPFLR